MGGTGVKLAPYYQDDLVTLYHGDCLEHLDVLDQADVMVTDPPYGIDWSPAKGGYRGKGSQTVIKSAIKNDRNLVARDAALAAWGKGHCLWIMEEAQTGGHTAQAHLAQKGSSAGAS